MKHTLTNPVKLLLEQADYLGFTCSREAADFILANVDWYVLLKDVKFKDHERVIINSWRNDTVASELVRCTQKPIPTCSSINYFESPSFGGKVSKTGGSD